MERCHDWVTSIVGGQRELGPGTALHKQGPSPMFQNGMRPRYPRMINHCDFTLAKRLILEAFSNLSSVVIEGERKLKQITKN